MPPEDDLYEPKFPHVRLHCMVLALGIILRKLRHEILLTYLLAKTVRGCSHIVAYMLKARTVESEKQSLLGNGCVTRNNVVAVGNGVFYAARAEAI
jgi:hypothetical protein